MPEGDTIHAAAARIRAALGPGPVTQLAGARVAVQARRIVGTPVSAVYSHGKHLVVEAGDWAIRTHLGMHGRWTTHEPARLPREAGNLRVLVATNDGAGACWSAPSVDVDRMPAIRRWLDTNLGPDLIRTGIDDRVVPSAMRDPSRRIADVLLDQRVAAGIGNVYKSELCFRAGVHPDRAIGELSPQSVQALFEDATELLRINSHRRERLTTGIDRPGQHHWVYGRPGRGCRRCNTPIERDGSGERVTFWCPRCQPLDR